MGVEKIRFEGRGTTGVGVKGKRRIRRRRKRRR